MAMVATTFTKLMLLFKFSTKNEIVFYSMLLKDQFAEVISLKLCIDFLSSLNSTKVYGKLHDINGKH